MPRVFISHSSKDKEFVRRLTADLQKLGHVPWLDEWEIRVGDCIPTCIEAGLRDAEYVVVVLSPEAVASGWVDREWKARYLDEVERKSVNILPVLLKDCEIPLLLRTRKYADFRERYELGLVLLSMALVPRPVEQALQSPAPLVPSPGIDHNQVHAIHELDLSAAAEWLAITRPVVWEHRLFAQVLADEIGRRRDQRRDFENAVAWPKGAVLSVTESINRLQEEMRLVLAIGPTIDRLMSQALTKALGPPGEPGDAEQLVYVGRRLGETYGRAIEWTLGIMQVNVDPALVRIQQLISRLLSNVVREIEDFSSFLSRELDSAAREIEQAEKEGRAPMVPIERTLTLTLTVPDSVVEELSQEFERLVVG